MSEQTASKVPQIRFTGFEGDWEDLQFRDIVSSLSGGAAIKPEDYQTSGFRTVPKGAVNSTGIADLDGCKFISKEFFERNTTSQASTGDLVTSLRDLVPSAPNLGRIVKIKGGSEDFLMPQGVYKITLHANIDENFVISYSNSGEFRKVISSEKNGSTQVHLRNGEFLSITIFTPTHLEQTQIGTYFRELDQLIEGHQRKYDKLLTLKKAMLQKMFPQAGAATPEIRFGEFSGEWEVKQLRDVGEFNPKEALPEIFEYVDLESVVGTEMVSHRTETKKTAPSRAQRLARQGDLFFQTVRPYQKNNYLFNLPFADYIFSTGYAQIRPFGDGSFLLGLMQRAQFVKVVLDNCTGTSYPAINSNVLAGIRVSVPKPEEQQKIGSYFRTIDELISKHAIQLQKLKQIKSACLEKMFV
jgi:type I restriction enzyme S subunit